CHQHRAKATHAERVDRLSTLLTEDCLSYLQAAAIIPSLPPLTYPHCNRRSLTDDALMAHLVAIAAYPNPPTDPPPSSVTRYGLRSLKGLHLHWQIAKSPPHYRLLSSGFHPIDDKNGSHFAVPQSSFA